MSGGTVLLFALLGLGLGMGLSYLIRRWRGTTAKGQQAAPPVVYASRQEARKAARELRKRQ